METKGWEEVGNMEQSDVEDCREIFGVNHVKNA